MPKILHCADVHLGSKFSKFGAENSKHRVLDQQKTFENMIEYVKNNRIDLLLISGDLFDSVAVANDSIAMVKKKFGEIANTRVFISPGNHDPYCAASCYKHDDFPPNVHIFRGGIERVEVGDVHVYGAAFLSGDCYNAMLEGFRVEDASKINIMTLHGELVAGGQQSTYNPVTRAHISESGLDYLALGHTHLRSLIEKAGTTRFAYSGSMIGISADETGERGGYAGEVRKGGVDLAFVPFCPRNYVQIDVDVTDCENLSEMREKIVGAIGTSKLCRVNLVGSIGAGIDYSAQVLEGDIKSTHSLLYLDIKDFTQIKLDFDAVSRENTLRGRFVARMLEKIKKCGQDEKELANAHLALKYGLAALDGQKGGVVL